ncbi:hypothetical protein IQ06DRAFT_351124 [Phaeosphaeriaceae sp. SRC1lsM3a]|nr:hypothetical protein IQ06DRAFT_351124 [Stagonospora sp. SRC1lsM3a]
MFKKILEACGSVVAGVQLIDAEHITVIHYAHYKGNDKAELLAYMAKEGLRQPTNVCLETIVEIVDLKMHGTDKDA